MLPMKVLPPPSPPPLPRMTCPWCRCRQRRQLSARRLRPRRARRRRLAPRHSSSRKGPFCPPSRRQSRLGQANSSRRHLPHRQRPLFPLPLRYPLLSLLRFLCRHHRPWRLCRLRRSPKLRGLRAVPRPAGVLHRLAPKLPRRANKVLRAHHLAPGPQLLRGVLPRQWPRLYHAQLTPKFSVVRRSASGTQCVARARLWRPLYH